MVSYKDLELLRELNKILKKKKIITWNELMQTGLKLGFTKNYIKFRASWLKKHGYLFNPVRNGWILTDKAKKLLIQVGENNETN